MYTVKINGFKTKEQALEFMQWYEGGGEQAFGDHLEDVGKDPKNGCFTDMQYPGNTGRYWDDHETEITFDVQTW